MQRRISGEALAPIPEINDELNLIMLKACEYDRVQRFKDAHEMRVALESISASISSTPIISIPEPPTQDSEYIDFTEATRTASSNEKTQIVFSRSRTPVVDNKPDEQIEPEIKIPEATLKTLAIFSSVFWIVLSALTFLSSNRSDIFTFLPIYVLCLAQCRMKFSSKHV